MTRAAPEPAVALRLFRERFLNRTDMVAFLTQSDKPCPAEAKHRSTPL